MMELDLGKEVIVGVPLTLDKAPFTGNKFGVGVDWDPADPNAPAVDCDLWAVELDANGRFSGNLLDIAFYKLPNQKEYTHNQTKSAKAAEKDNVTGQDDPNKKDDEFLTVDLDNVLPGSAGIAVCLNIFDGVKKGQTFGKMKKLRIRLVRGDHQDGEPVAAFVLDLNHIPKDATGIEYVRFIRKADGTWDFEGRNKVLGNAEEGSRINTAAPKLVA